MYCTWNHDEWLQNRQAMLNESLQRLRATLDGRSCISRTGAASATREVGATTYDLALASEGLAYVVTEEIKHVHIYMFDLMSRLHSAVGFEPGDSTTDQVKRQGLISFKFVGVPIHVTLVVGDAGRANTFVQTEDALRNILDQRPRLSCWSSRVKAAPLPEAFGKAAKALKLLAARCGWISPSNLEAEREDRFSPTAFTILLCGMCRVTEADRSASAGDLVINILQEFGQFNRRLMEIRLEAENVPVSGKEDFCCMQLNAAYFRRIGPGVPAQIKLNEGASTWPAT